MKHLLRKISLFMVAVMSVFSVFANGIEYKGVYYILDNENLTASVTYTGATPEENNYSGEINLPTKFKYNDVYYKVTSIGEKAFYGCDGIVFVNISALITDIASEAFGNNAMESLIIPATVKNIATDAFKGSNISLFMLGSFDDYSFLDEVNISTPVFALEQDLQKILEVWKGEAKNIETLYYLEDLSTMTTIAFRLHKTEYYSLPNSLFFEFSSVITHGVEIHPDPETGIYTWDGLTPGETSEFIINYNLDYEDLAQTVKLSSVLPVIECLDREVALTTFKATILASEEEGYVPTEKGIIVDGVKYKANESNSIEIIGLAEDTEYKAKPYAIYKNKTYYGEEFVFITKNSTSISNITAVGEAKVILNNVSRNGYIEVSVNCEGDVAYSIVNITGQTEKEGILEGNSKLNNIVTDELLSGIYLLNVNGKKINKTLKFIVR